MISQKVINEAGKKARHLAGVNKRRGKRETPAERQDRWRRERTTCHRCNAHFDPWESLLEFAVLTGELQPYYKFFHKDCHIRCSPSRAQHIIHDKFPAIVDDRLAFDRRLWEDRRRRKQQRIYTKAWVKLQVAFNPNWKGTK